MWLFNRKKKSEFAKLYKITAEQAVRNAKQIYKININFEINSLDSLEEIFDDLHMQYRKETAPKVSTMTLLSWGSYLGQTIIKHFGGEWGANKEISIKGIQIDPFDKIEKRILQGKSESLKEYIKSLEELISQIK